MTLVLRRIWVYFKFIAIVAVIAMILAVVLLNREYTATVWFFGKYENVNVLWLMLITAISAIITWWGVFRIFGVVREMRELKRRGQAEQALQEQRRLAQEMAERERRIDEKVKRSISGPEAG
jgi:hypothetical protein